MTQEKEKPVTHFTITAQDKSKEIFMSFGLLNILSGYFQEIEQLELLYSNPDLQLAILNELVCDRDEKGRPVIPSLITVDMLEIDAVWEILEWAQSHIIDFFIQALMRRNQGRIRMMEKIQTISESSVAGT